MQTNFLIALVILLITMEKETPLSEHKQVEESSPKSRVKEAETHKQGVIPSDYISSLKKIK